MKYFIGGVGNVFLFSGSQLVARANTLIDLLLRFQLMQLKQEVEMVINYLEDYSIVPLLK